MFLTPRSNPEKYRHAATNSESIASLQHDESEQQFWVVSEETVKRVSVKKKTLDIYLTRV